jgi:DMSO/TMAO reductase YedYZ molybdopterin-dependent catalytic subunit
MHFPWANILLLILLIIQFVTGYWGMVNGRDSFRWILWLHGIGAYGLVVLLYWKSDIILHAWRRKRRWTGRRLIFALTALLLLFTLFLGILWTFQGPIYLFGFSLLSLHIYVAVPLTLLMLWHAWHMRFITRLPQAIGRRLFLKAAVTGAAGWWLWQAAAWSKAIMALPGLRRRFTGSYETGSHSGRFPVVSWIADDPSPIDPQRWQLRLEGAVQRPLSLSFDELSQLAFDSRLATLDCTGGWFTIQEWEGIEVSQLLSMAGIRDDAASVSFRAVSGYQRRFSLSKASNFLLALKVAGQPLSHGHGAPVRLVAGENRGLAWVKWVSHIQVNTSGPLWQLPLPLR